MPSTINERNQSADIFRLLLIFMVVAIHVNVFSEIRKINFFTVDGYFRMAVPIFFIINGYFFQQYVTDKFLFRKWLCRALLLFAVWQIIYLPMYIPTDGLTPQYIAVFISQALFGYHHLWYVAAMASGGVILYYVKDLRYALLLCVSLFIIGWILQYARIFLQADSLMFKVFSQYWIFRNGLFFGFPMMFIGVYIAKNNLIEKLSKTRCVILLFFSFLLFSLELCLTNIYLFKKISYHIDFIISLLIFCPLLFILLMKSNVVYFTHLKSKSFALIAAAVYFVHPYVIFFLEKYLNLSVSLLYALTLIFSLIVAFLLFSLRKKLFFIF